MPRRATPELAMVVLTVLFGAAGCGTKQPMAPLDDTLLRLTNDARVETGLAWSPSGGQLMIAAQEGTYSQLFVLDCNNGRVTPFASATGNLSQPDWSPDGATILCTFDDAGVRSVRPWLYPGGAAAPFDIPCDSAEIPCETSPTWSPAGDRLALRTARCYEPSGGIYTYTSGYENCTPVVSMVFGDGFDGLNWANQSELLAYWYLPNASPNTRLRVVDIETGAGYDVVPGGWKDRDPDWSPDDSMLCFVSTRGGTVDIWVVAADNSAPARRITNDDIVESCPRWSPDGRRIACIADRDGQVDVWSVKVPSDVSVHF